MAEAAALGAVLLDPGRAEAVAREVFAVARPEMFWRPASLDSKPNRARLFYGTIAMTTLAGALMQYAGVNPVRALYWSAVINGILAAPLMVKT